MELGAVARRPELSLWYHQQYCSPGVKTCYLILIADTRLSSLIVIQRCSLPRFGRLLLLLEACFRTCGPRRVIVDCDLHPFLLLSRFTGVAMMLYALEMSE
jgi:hypothetical protein